MNKKLQLTEVVLDVVKALSELHLMVDKDEFMLDMFNKGCETTGALPCSLDEFIGEWQTLANNIEMDALALYESWAKSAKLFKEAVKTQHHLEMGLNEYDVVFEDGSYIRTLFKINNSKPVIMWEVQIGNESNIWGENDFDRAVKCLWENHAKVSYGL